MTTLSTCWGFVINNPDDNDKLLVRSPNEQHVKQIVVTPEEASTPHLQGWIKLHRQQRLSFVKKLLPRANFKALTNDEYILNARMYALKDDETTAGNHVITTNETMPDPINFLQRVIEDWLEYNWETLTEHTLRRVNQQEQIQHQVYSQKDCFRFLDQRERELIEEKPWLVKLVLSPMYAKAKKSYWKEILSNRIHNKNAIDETEEGSQSSDSEGDDQDDHIQDTDDEEESGTTGSISEGSEDSEEGSGDEACD